MRTAILFFLISISVTSYATINPTNNSNFKVLDRKDDHKNLAGRYTLYVDGKTYNMEIFIRCNKPKAKITMGDQKIASKFVFKKNVITISLHKEDIYIKLIGKILNTAGVIGGVAIDSNGKQSEWSAAKLIKDERSIIKSTKKVTN